MSKPAAIRSLSKALRDFFASDRALPLLRKYGFGWTDGGCVVLADAVLGWLGSAGPVALVGRRAAPTLRRQPVQAQHALVRIGPWYVDAEGIRSRSETLERWRSEVEAARLVADPNWARMTANIAIGKFIRPGSGALRNQRISATLAKRLTRAFPPAQALGVLQSTVPVAYPRCMEGTPT